MEAFLQTFTNAIGLSHKPASITRKIPPLRPYNQRLSVQQKNTFQLAHNHLCFIEHDSNNHKPEFSQCVTSNPLKT